MIQSIVPDYLTDFSCIGNMCEDTCCASWQVTVDKKTYKKYQKVKDPNLRKMLQETVKRNRKAQDDAQYATIKMDSNNLCPLLDDGLCGIQKNLGASYLSHTCAVYPRITTRVHSMQEQSLTLSCPEAARIVLLRPEGIGFTEQHSEPDQYVQKTLTEQQQPYFWDIRIFIIRLMQNRTQPVTVRLAVVGLFLQKIESLQLSEYRTQLPIIMNDYEMRLKNEAFIASLQDLPRRSAFQLRLTRSLFTSLLTYVTKSPKFTSLLLQMEQGLQLDKDELNVEAYEEAYARYYVPFMATYDYIIENYIVNYIFSTVFPYSEDSLRESYMMLVVNLLVIKMKIIGVAVYKEELTLEDVIYCIQQSTKATEHNVTYRNAIRQAMVEAEYTTMGHFITLIK